MVLHVQAETIAVHELPYPANCKQTYLSHVVAITLHKFIGVSMAW